MIRNAAIRALRTYVQTFIGLLLATWGGQVVDWHTGLTILQVAALGAVPAVLSLIRNMLEGDVTYNRG